MSDSSNPWQSPGTAIKVEENSIAQGGMTPVMVRYLKEASPWLRFYGIMGYIGSGLVAVGGVIMMIAFAVTGESFGSGVTSAFGALTGLIYLIGGVMAFFPARFAHGFGVKIRNYLLSNTEQDLEEALRNNKSLWKFNGILLIVSLAIIPIVIIILVVVAVTAPGLFNF
ncbi:MAG: hypothetical protein LBT39_10220 [Treponema sp.]|jgi:hypothetical protein|nr:hypothetical protein [Treponema sp.]